MKKRSLSLIVIVTAITMFLTANTAFAGRKHHERWKGIAIGVGAVILADAIFNGNNNSVRVSEPCYVKVPAPPPRYRAYHKGHWEIRDEWVPPTYKTVWNPGHYNRKGDWIKGAWIKIVDKPGYWKEERVWVSAKVSRRRH